MDLVHLQLMYVKLFVISTDFMFKVYSHKRFYLEQRGCYSGTT